MPSNRNSFGSDALLIGKRPSSAVRSNRFVSTEASNFGVLKFVIVPCAVNCKSPKFTTQRVTASASFRTRPSKSILPGIFAPLANRSAYATSLWSSVIVAAIAKSSTAPFTLAFSDASPLVFKAGCPSFFNAATSGKRAKKSGSEKAFDATCKSNTGASKCDTEPVTSSATEPNASFTAVNSSASAFKTA